MFSWNSVKGQRVISVIGHLAILAIAIDLFSTVWSDGIQVMQAGSWTAPFGITFVADTFSATLVLLTAIAGLAVGVFSTVTVHTSREHYGYYPIFHLLLMGLFGAFLTGDLFNLYVWFEIMIIASFVLLTLGGDKSQLEGAMKYMTLNLLASTFFLTAVGIVYGLTGTLNMADIAVKMKLIEHRGLVSVTAILFFIGFGIKSAVFPLYSWLPASYHTPQTPITAIFGGLMTKVGVYAIMRVFTLMFIQDEFTRNLIMVVAIATMIAGGLGALMKNNIRQIFGYLIVCHIGFMIGGLSMFSIVAYAGAVFYLIHDIIVKTNIFLIAGVIHKLKGSFDQRELGGIYQKYPYLSILFILPLLSLVGIPPLSGFWPKINLLEAAFVEKHYLVGAAIIIGSFITLFVIARMWAEVFWKLPGKKPTKKHAMYFNKLTMNQKRLIILPIIFLTLVSLYIGFGAERIVQVSETIANELMDPSPYINTVLNSLNEAKP